MPCSYYIDENVGIAVVCVHGRITGMEAADIYRRYLDDPAWIPTYQVFWEIRGITEAVIDQPDVHTLARITREFADRIGPGRTAMLARREIDFLSVDSYSHLIARLAMRNPEREVKAFSSIMLAAEWLGLPADDLERLIDCAPG